MTNEELIEFKVKKIKRNESSLVQFILDFKNGDITLFDLKVEALVDKQDELAKLEESKVVLNSEISDLSK